MSQKYKCPVCGWDQLNSNPYKNMPAQPHPITTPGHYESVWGMGSAEVCPCCGFEYGNDDHPEFGAHTFESYFELWRKRDFRWFDSKARPPAWDLATQMVNAGIHLPPDIALKNLPPRQND